MRITFAAWGVGEKEEKVVMRRGEGRKDVQKITRLQTYYLEL